ncbi:hypothetical protein KC19_2G229300 [Ceratodon purpureus]|uniref:Uncharacterized protein n=1 Tax=Ceratodon purpureus TaxID=3225 RepID=A0A8T0IZS1_CERPU|nr:hypothetical protein KC19_2G229300 [Ceratodon purpureus]
MQRALQISNVFTLGLNFHQYTNSITFRHSMTVLNILCY